MKTLSKSGSENNVHGLGETIGIEGSPGGKGQVSKSFTPQQVKSGKAAYTVRVRLADPDVKSDRAAIERLWLDNLPYINEAILSDRFDWLYKHNPAGRTLTWFAVDVENSGIVGCASVLPREMVIDGKVFQGGVAVDFAIDRPYRSFGIALQLQRAISTQVWERGIDLMFSFPNEESRGIFQRIGYCNVGNSWRGAQLLRSFPKLRQHNYPMPVAAVTGFGIDLIFHARNMLSLFSEQSGLRGVLLDAPDERWEVFWNKLLPDLWFGGVHDLSYIRWRYQLSPGESNRYFCLLDESDNLLAYLVFSTQGEVLMVDDIQALQECLLKSLLARFWKEMRKAGAIVINISVVGSSALIDSLNQAGFVTRDTDGWAGILVGPGLDIDLPKLLEQQNKKWYLANAEVDL